MRNVKAIFKKQIKNTVKSPETLIQFIIFPLLAFVMLSVMDMDFEGVPEDIVELLTGSMPNMVTMQATIFAGMGLIPIVVGIISEDIEKKSLRFLMMAGVKPMSYLIGVTSVVFFVSIFSSAAFSLIGGFRGQDFWIFTAAMMSSVTASIMVGAIIGVLSTHQQTAQGLAMPIALVLGFGPMMAQFNDNIARFLHVFYTQQLNLVADYLSHGVADTPLWQSFAIIWANVAVLGVLFALVYARKGLKN